ncbi:unnamed protein product [Macrosiphum euphorbiae]|uniref:BED-type domain-containing protein n=1 Tax=Macrosiphum euphorbiae TaxID=13131 RepID=A0AAV0WCJ4_9HEMI|nr:unnamed protein product [Macrosiphum euphorbiae]
MSWLKKNSSVVWNYFINDVNNSNEAHCSLCKKTYQRSSGTSNLMEHLKRKHMTRLERDNIIQAKEKDQNEIQNSINIPGTSRASQPHDTLSTVPVVTNLTNKINSNETTIATTASEPPLKRQKQLVLSNRFGAPSELQIKAFYEAIILDSRYTIPSRRALGRTIIPNMYTNVRNKVQTLLNDTSYIAITTDIWTSINTDSFKTMTAHFFPKGQSKLKTVVMYTKNLEHSHTGAHLAQIMTSELNSWGILDKVVGIVTDGGSNIKSAVRLMDIQHIPCRPQTKSYSSTSSISQ